jgi:gas vesicle protein
MFNISKKIKKIKNYQIVNRGDVTKKLLLTGLLTGVVGSISTFLTTKKNGEQNRKEIIKASQKLGDEAKKNLEKLGEFSTEVKEKIHSEKNNDFSGIKNKVKEIAGKTKKIINKVKNQKKDVKKEIKKEIIDVEVEIEKKV